MVLVLLVLFVFSFLVAVPFNIQVYAYTIAVNIQNIMMAILPYLISALFMQSMLNLSSHAWRFLILVFLGVCVSNALATGFGGCIGHWIYQSDHTIQHSSIQTMSPLGLWSIKPLISNTWAMIIGLTLGLVCRKWATPEIKKKIYPYLSHIIFYILKIVQCIMPIMIFGFLMKMQYEKSLVVISQHYGKIMGVVILAQIAYIGLGYVLWSLGKGRSLWQAIRLMFPANVHACVSMSSAATMPLTLVGVGNDPIARSVVPMTVNIHLLGDCIAIPIFAFSVLQYFGCSQPSLAAYLGFLFYFVMNKFSVAAVPGGGIIVMLPILAHYLHIQGEMAAMITLLYILFDPIITCANVWGNGCFARMISACFQSLHRDTI